MSHSLSSHRVAVIKPCRRSPSLSTVDPLCSLRSSLQLYTVHSAYDNSAVFKSKYFSRCIIICRRWLWHVTEDVLELLSCNQTEGGGGELHLLMRHVQIQFDSIFFIIVWMFHRSSVQTWAKHKNILDTISKELWLSVSIKLGLGLIIHSIADVPCLYSVVGLCVHIRLPRHHVHFKLRSISEHTKCMYSGTSAQLSVWS